MDDDDDFGGFEVAETDFDPAVDVEHGLEATSSATPDVSAIPWLAASLQASAKDSSSPSAVETLSNTKESLFTSAFSDISSPSSINWSKDEHVGDKTEKPSVTLSSTPVVDTALAKDLQAQLQTALEEKQKYRSEAADLRLKHEELSRSLERLQRDLAEQKTKYEEVQVRHKAELEGLKESNQKAVSLIIEEYKESMRLSIIEQQLSSTKVFTEQIEKEASRFEKILSDQTKSYENWKTEFSEKLTKKYEESLARLQQEVDTEKTKLLEKNESEMNSAKEELAKMKSEALQEVESCLSSKMADLQSNCKSLVDAATDQLHSSVKSQLTQVADDQRSLSMDYWEKQSCEMSARLEATLESSMTSHRESLDTYLAERVQRDKELQRRNLAAVGVYLEAASKHITTLMNS